MLKSEFCEFSCNVSNVGDYWSVMSSMPNQVCGQLEP